MIVSFRAEITESQINILVYYTFRIRELRKIKNGHLLSIWCPLDLHSNLDPLYQYAVTNLT